VHRARSKFADVLRGNRKILEGLGVGALTGVGDDNLLGGRGAVETFDFLGKVPPLFTPVAASQDSAKHSVTAVQMRGRDGGDEELRAVRVGASVGHGEETFTSMLQLKVLGGELLAVNRFTAGAIAVGEIAALEHKILDDTMETRSLVAEALLASAEGAEVLSGLRGFFAVETHVDSALGLAANGDVEPDLLGNQRPLAFLGFFRKSEGEERQEELHGVYLR